MAKPICDDRDWPLLRVKWPPEVNTEEIDAHFDEMLQYARRNEKFVVLVDARQGQSMDARARKRVAQRLEAIAQEGEVVATAFIASSSLARGVITALNWLFTPPFPSKVFTGSAAGEAWARERLAAAVAAGGAPRPRRSR